MKQREPKVVPHEAHPGMWQVQWPDGSLSNMTNLTRGKGAIACFKETEERRQRGLHRPSEGRLVPGDAVEILGLSRCSAYSAARMGALPIRIGKRLIVPRLPWSGCWSALQSNKENRSSRENKARRHSQQPTGSLENHNVTTK